MDLKNNQADIEFDIEKVKQIMNKLIKCNKEKNEYLDLNEMYEEVLDSLESGEYLSEEEKNIEDYMKILKPEIIKELRKLDLIDENGNPKQIGVCHTEWAITKRLMKERFGIDWKTPAELTPWIDFD